MRWISFIVICLLVSCSSDGKKQRKHEIGKIKSFVCLVYHRFGAEQHPSTSISLDNFRAHLEYLKANNYVVLTLSEALKYLHNEEENKNVVVITVDDGYKSFLTGAVPLLSEFRFPATIFVNTKTVGSGSYMTWDQLRGLSQHGIEIGNHSHSHAYFLDVPEDKQVDFFAKDVLKAQTLFQEHLNVAPDVFAYPYGEFSPEMKKVIKDLGFTAAAAQSSGAMASNGDFYAIPRFPMTDAYGQPGAFAEKLSIKPLEVIEHPKSMVLGNADPPVLELTLQTDSLAVGRLQCFVQGGKCDIKVVSGEPFKIEVQSKTALTRRRTLYTITVPSVQGDWYWYSHLWVKTGQLE